MWLSEVGFCPSNKLRSPEVEAAGGCMKADVGPDAVVVEGNLVRAEWRECGDHLWHGLRPPVSS